MSRHGEAFREIILDALGGIAADDVAVLLSGGIDSASLLIGLLEIGKRPIAYSFTLDGRVSTDCSLARKNARILGVPFRTILLPADPATLESDVRRLIGVHSVSGKAAVECTWPVYRSMLAIAEKFIVTGSAADGYFGLSKKAMIHSKGSLPQFRRAYFSRENPAQCRSNARIGCGLGKSIVSPYYDRSREFLEALGEAGWSELNKPRQKMPIRDAFPKLASLETRPHTNLQLGDSGIANHFGLLLRNPSLNRRGFRSTVGIYNAIAKGAI